MTGYKSLCAAWKDCTACPLHARRKRVVQCRGSLPCDVLLIGEAPGVSEDVLGVPFVGPAGKLLDRIVRDATAGNPVKVAFANLLGCVPLAEDGSGKVEEPPDDSVQTCAPRLIELVRLADPRLIVLVGKCPQHWVGGGFKHSLKLHRKIPTVGITHPAAILRDNVANRGLAVQRCVVTIMDALEKLT